MTPRTRPAAPSATAVPRQITRIGLVGFGMILLLIWLDELLDLPHWLLGDPPTHIRLGELALESIGVLILAGVVLYLTGRVMQRLAYLERFVVVCAWCRRVRQEQKWLSFEAYLGEYRAETSHGMCPECEVKFADSGG